MARANADGLRRIGAATARRHTEHRATIAAKVSRGGCGVPGCTAPDCPIKYGYCHGGCGERTSLAPQSALSRNLVKGEPYLYVVGHNTRHGCPGSRVLAARDGGEQLRRARLAAGLSQHELARRAGTTGATICQLEGIAGRRVSLKLASAIADALGATRDEVFTTELCETPRRARTRPATPPTERRDRDEAKAAATEQMRQWRAELEAEAAARGLVTLHALARRLDRTTSTLLNLARRRGLGEPFPFRVPGPGVTYVFTAAEAEALEAVVRSNWQSDVKRRVKWYWRRHKKPTMAGRYSKELAALEGKTVGKPPKVLTDDKERRIRDLIAKGNSQRTVARMLGVSRGLVQHVLTKPRKGSGPLLVD